jgi:hypothetical protein
VNIMRLILIASFCLAAAACSRGDENRLREDARSAGHDVSQAAQNLQNDPTVRHAGAEARQAGHDAAVSLRKGAAEAEYKTGQAMVDAGNQAKRNAHEQARADSSGQSQN